MFDFHRFKCKLVVCLVLVLSFFLLPKFGFISTFHVCSDSIAAHFLYPLSHANIFHLIVNILCLFMLQCPMRLHITYPIAVIASFLPCFTLYGLITGSGFLLSEPTMGFSGVLFAMVGISWGLIHRFRLMLWKNKWFLIIPAFLPHMNLFIHLYCLLFGYLAGHLLSCKRLSTAL